MPLSAVEAINAYVLTRECKDSWPLQESRRTRRLKASSRLHRVTVVYPKKA